MPGELQPLVSNQQIVNADGTPTEYFIRWAQDRQIDIGEGITALQAQELIDDWAATRTLNAGVGLDGGGDLSADRTFDLADTAVMPGTYGDATHSAVLTIDQQGRVTDADEVPISGGGGGGGPWYFAPPAAADFTLANSGCGDLTLTDDTNVGLLIASPPSFSGALNAAIAYQALPSGVSYIATMRFGGGLRSQEYCGMGMAIRRAATGALYTFGHRIYGTTPAIMVNRWNSLPSFNSDALIESFHLTPEFPWRRIIYDLATNTYTFQISSNGAGWYTVLVEAVGTFLGAPADEVGFFMGSNIGTAFFQAYIDNWSVV